MSGIKKAWKATHPARRKIFNSTRLVGVEWEYNTCSKKVLKSWQKKWRGSDQYDGSCGWEAVTAPLSGDYVVQCLQDLGKALKKGAAKIDNRCSIHVHVDGSDLSWRDMYRLLWVYSRVEDALFYVGGSDRRNSDYCEPCGDRFRAVLVDRFDKENAKKSNKTDVMEGVLDVVYWDRHEDVDAKGYYRRYATRRDEGRYKAINICPWLNARKRHTTDMTVEFRLHEYTSNATRVIKWTQLLVQMVDWVKKHTDQRAKQLPENGLLALCVMAPKSRRWLLKQANRWNKVFEL